MARLVQKFGGTSVGSIERIQHVADKVIKSRRAGNDVVVVVSAMSGETNRLVGLASEISQQPTARELDVLLSTGEQVTIALLCMALIEKNQAACSFTGGQINLLTDNSHGKARIKSINSDKILNSLDQGSVVVIAGFQGITDSGDISTLGRGGSDTSAVAVAAAINADECQIYTDVKGVYTTDPRVVPEARLLEKITFEEMLEMASLGSKVLQIRAVEFAGKHNVPLRVISTFEEGQGTLITYDEEESMEQALISGLAFNRDEAQITIKGVPDKPGIAFKILGAIADANIEVDMIVQNIAGDETTDFTFTVHRNDFKRSLKILSDNASQLELTPANVTGDDKIVKVSMVGVGMRSHAGIASKMFQVLANEGINIRMISTSEIKISVIVDEKYLELAVRALHSAFELESPLSKINSNNAQAG